jgi:hypothetical protein
VHGDEPGVPGAGRTGVVLRVFDLGDGTEDYGSEVGVVAAAARPRPGRASTR